MFNKALQSFTGRFRRALDRWKLRRLRLASLSLAVSRADGLAEPAAEIFSDSGQASLDARLVFPPLQSDLPVRLRLDLSDPAGTPLAPVTCELTSPAPFTTVSFRLDLPTVRSHRGRWRARLTLADPPLALGEVDFRVNDRSALLEDLEAFDEGVAVYAGGKPVVSPVVLSDAESVVPLARIRPKTYSVDRYNGVTAVLELCRPNQAEAVESMRLPLRESEGDRQGTWSLNWWQVPVAGTPMARRRGKWEFRLSIEGRPLCVMPFTVVSRASVLGSLKVEHFDVIAIRRDGSPCVIDAELCHGEVKELRPVVRLVTPYPTPLVRYHTSLAMFVNGEPVGEASQVMEVSHSPWDVLAGPFELAAKKEGTARVEFLLFVEGSVAARRSILMLPARVADAEGRLADRTPLMGPSDYEREADRILAEARVGR